MSSNNSEKIKMTVYINLGLLTCAVIYAIYSMVQLEKTIPAPTSIRYPEEYGRIKKSILLSILYWTIVVLSTSLFNMLLLRGVNQRNHRKCMIWFILNSFWAGVQIYKIILCFMDSNWVEGSYLVIWASFSIYALYLVKSFMTELSSDSSMQPLTNKE